MRNRWMLPLILATVAVLGMMALFWLAQAHFGSAAKRSLIAAEWVPEDAVFFLHYPDLGSAAAQWNDSDLHQLWEATDIEAFLGPQLGVEQLEGLNRLMKGMEGGSFENLFLAGGFEDDQTLALYGGFEGEFTGEDLVYFLPQVAVQGSGFTSLEFMATPAASFSLHTATHAFPFFLHQDKDFVCFSTTEEGIEKMKLLKSLQKGEGSLASNHDFQKVAKKLKGRYGSLFYGKPAGDLVDFPRLLKRTGLIGRGVKESQVAGMQALGIASGFREGKLFDQVYVDVKAPQIEPTFFEGTSMELTTRETVFYYGARLDTLSVPEGPVDRGAGDMDAVSDRLLKDLFEAGWGLDKLATVFEGEFAFHAERDLEKDEFFFGFSMEIIDPERLEDLLELLISGRVQSARLERMETDKTERPVFSLEIDMGDSLWAKLMPDLNVLIGDKYLMVNSNFEAAIDLQRRAGNASRTLRRNPEFRALTGLAGDPDYSLLWMDSASIYESLHETISHPLVMASIWMALKTQTRVEVDFSSLPDPDVVSEHTHPTMITVSHDEDGVLQDAVGSLIPSMWIIQTGGMASKSSVSASQD